MSVNRLGGVFISYSRSNKTTALRIRRDLQLNGIADIFLDIDPRDGIRPGSRFEKVLRDRVISSNIFLMLVSKKYLRSKYCHREFVWAIEQHDRSQTEKPAIIPVFIHAYPSDDRGDVHDNAVLEEPTDDDIKSAPFDFQPLRALQRYPSDKGDPPIKFELLTDLERDHPDHQIVREQKRARQRLWGFLEGELLANGVTPLRLPFRDRKPYPGLKAFKEEDAPVFFGREAEVTRLTEQLLNLREARDGGAKLLVIQAASGAGKSSVLRAGILSRLKLGYHRDFYCLPTLQPGTRAISGVRSGFVTAIKDAFDAVKNYPPELYMDPATNRVVQFPRLDRRPVPSREEIEAAVASGAPALERLLSELVALTSPEAPRPEQTASSHEQEEIELRGDPVSLVLPIDQAEELFPLAGGPVKIDPEHRREAEALRSLLSELLNRRKVDLLVVIAIRSDSFPRLQEDPLLGQLGISPFNLSPMPDASYRSIIEEPAKLAKLDISPELTHRLLIDLGRADPVTRGRADALPLLAFTLNQLEEMRNSRPPEVRAQLTRELYAELGGFEGALERVIKKAVKQVTDKTVKQVTDEILRRTFIPWLATVDPQSGQFIRRIGKGAEFPSGDDEHVSGERIARELRDVARIIISREKDDEYEVAHEAVLRQWTRLSGWLDDAKGALWALQEAREAAKLWADARRAKLDASNNQDSAELTRHDRTQQWPQARLDPVWDGLNKVGSSREGAEEPLRTFIRPEFDRLVEELARPGVDHTRRAEIGDRLAQLGERSVGNEPLNYGDLRPGVNLLTPSRVELWLEETSSAAESARRRGLQFWHAAFARTGLHKADNPLSEDDNAIPDIVWCKIPRGRVTIHRDEDALKDWAKAVDEADAKGEAAPALDANPLECAVADELWIAKYPLTYAQFVAFAGAGQNRPDQYKGDPWWYGFASDTDFGMHQWFKNQTQDQATAGNYPAQYLTWYQGFAYCRWLTRRLRDLGGIPEKGEIRLPTEAEWVMAATGGDPRRRFPWGSEWDPAKSSNQDEAGGANRFVATGLYPANRSPIGAMDMSGNVYEWCLNNYDDLDDLALDREVDRATKGGAYYTQPFNRPVSHAQSVHHRFRDHPWGLTRGRAELGSTRIAAGIRLVYQGPDPQTPAFQKDV